jgi:hypothetical protein
MRGWLGRPVRRGDQAIWARYGDRMHSMHVVSGLDYLEGLDHTCGFDQLKPCCEETEVVDDG